MKAAHRKPSDNPGTDWASRPGAAKPQVVVVGSSFAGLTAALDVKRRVKDRADVTVIDQRDYFTFVPSLIWVPFGTRDAGDVTFPLEPVYRKQGIRFMHATAERFDLDRHVVHTDHGDIAYDRLVVATGPRLAFERIPGLGPHGGHTHSVCTLDHALETRDAWQRFLKNPGPVVVGTAQDGSCFGASSEFLLNTRYQLLKAGLGDQPVTFISAEPFLGHFGLGGVGDSERRVERLFDKLGIRGIPNTTIESVSAGEMRLGSGEVLPFAFSMIVPPFTGVDAVTQTEGLANPAGFIPVTDEHRHPDHPEVFAAGVDIAIAPPTQTLVPAGVPKTGHMSEHMAKVAADNIAADLEGGEHRHIPVDELGAICILDAGNTGPVIKTDRVLGGGKHTHVMAAPRHTGPRSPSSASSSPPASMDRWWSEMSPIYTTGSWRPFPEHEQAFLDAWLVFAEWSMRMPGAGSAILARDQRDPGRFVSFVAWDALEAVRAWKTSPEFKPHMAQVQQHVDTFAPTELEVVASVPADVQALHKATTA